MFISKITKGLIYDLELDDSEVNLKRENNEFKVTSLLRTKGKFDFPKIKKISSLFNLEIKNLKDIKGFADLKTKINFNLDKRFQFKNLNYATDGNINYFEIHTDEKNFIKEYLPDYNSKIIIKDTKIKFFNSKHDNTLELDGFLKLKDLLKVSHIVYISDLAIFFLA